jgi:hypothetical protein
MGKEAPFPDAYAAYRPLGDDPKTFTVALTSANTAYSSVLLDTGVYRFWVQGGDASDVLVWKRSATDSTPAVSSPDANGEAVNSQPANVVETLRITSAERYVWAKLLAGASKTLHLSRISE